MGKNRDPIFGKCPVCGGHGGDDPDATGADTAATDTTGNGYPLVYYKGELMCNMCKKRKIADEESELVADKHAEAQEFRAKAGFSTTIS